MAGSVNKVTLIGNLGRDPEVRSFQNGGKICSLRIATSESWRDRDTGERKERTEWHAVTIHSEALVGLAEQYLRKGSKVYIEGQLETRKWQDQSGADRYTTEVVLRPYRGSLVFLDKQEGGAGGRSSSYDDGPRGGNRSGGGRGDNYQSPSNHYGGGSSDFDDDIPF